MPTFKVILPDQTRRFSTPHALKLHQLRNELRTRLQLQASRIQYIDDDEDRVDVTTEDEFDACLAFFGAKGAIRLIVTPKEAAPKVATESTGKGLAIGAAAIGRQWAARRAAKNAPAPTAAVKKSAPANVAPTGGLRERVAAKLAEARGLRVSQCSLFSDVHRQLLRELVVAYKQRCERLAAKQPKKTTFVVRKSSNVTPKPCAAGSLRERVAAKLAEARGLRVSQCSLFDDVHRQLLRELVVAYKQRCARLAAKQPKKTWLRTLTNAEAKCDGTPNESLDELRARIAAKLAENRNCGNVDFFDDQHRRLLEELMAAWQEYAKRVEAARNGTSTTPSGDEEAADSAELEALRERLAVKIMDSRKCYAALFDNLHRQLLAEIVEAWKARCVRVAAKEAAARKAAAKEASAKSAMLKAKIQAASARSTTTTTPRGFAPTICDLCHAKLRVVPRAAE